jgi:hypothetical protein
MREVIDLPDGQEYPASLAETDYMAVAEELRANGIIDDIPPFAYFFTNCAAANEK